MSDVKNKINKTGVTGIWGGRGAGKTYFSKTKIMPQLKGQTVIVIDPTHVGGHKKWPDAARELYAGGKNIIMSTSSRFQVLPLVYLAWAYSSKEAPIFVVCDEATRYMDKETDALSKIMFLGRHKSFGMLLMGQRAAALNAQNRSQIESTFWMRQSDHVDIDTAKKMIGPERAAKLSLFTAGEFIRHPPEQG